MIGNKFFELIDENIKSLIPIFICSDYAEYLMDLNIDSENIKIRYCESKDGNIFNIVIQYSRTYPIFGWVIENDSDISAIKEYIKIAAKRNKSTNEDTIH